MPILSTYKKTATSIHTTKMPPQDPLHSSNNSGDVKKEEEGSSFLLDPENSSNHQHHQHDDETTTPDDGGLLEQRPAGERERLESRRFPRESQTNVLAHRRQSFLVQFSKMKGPPQIAGLMALLAIGLGSTIGVVPGVMGDRFARLLHGYEGTAHCSSFTDSGSDVTKPEACFLGASDAQAAASLANLVNNGLTFLTASLTGSLSDEYGRKGILLLGLTMSMVPSLFLYVLQLTPTMSPWWYYGTSASTGLVSWIAVALSALNDVLPQEFRAPGIGLLFAGFLFGVCLSPTLALFLDRETLSLVSFAVVCLGFLMTIFFVPETLPANVGKEAKRRRKERDALEDENDRQQVEGQLLSGAPERRQQQHGYGFASFVSCLRRVYYGSCLLRIVRRVVTRPFKEMSILNRNSFFRIISALAFFTGMVTSADQVLLIYYLEDQLSFNAKDVSIMFLIIGATGIFVQVVVMKPLNDLVGEKMVVAISFAVGTVVNLLYGLARHKSTIFVALLIAGFSNMSFPTISAIKANNVESNEQGRIQGALYSVKALASGVGPAVLQYVYSKTKMYHGILLGPGTMFIFASGLFVIGVVLALSLPNDKANTSPRHGGRPTNQEGNNNNTSDHNEAMAMAMDDEALGEYRRLAAESSEDDDETYGSI